VRKPLWLLLGALASTACGSPSADLFSVQRSGLGEGARLALVVSDDGTVRCNDSAPVPLDAKRLLAARELSRQLARQAALGLELPAGRARDTTFRYRARLAEGHVAFADSSRGLPRSFADLAGFTRAVSRQVCKLRR
jgi:hypothetical protein